MNHFHLPLAAVVMATMLMSDNPFSKKSTLPYEAPDFTQIKVEHFKPAFIEGMAQELAEIQRIANNPEAPTFENTIVAMEQTGAMLSRAQRVFSNLTGTDTNPQLQAIQVEMSPLFAAHSDNILLNPALFARVKELHDKMDQLGLNEEQQQLLKSVHRRFVRAGAQLTEAQKTRIREINAEMSTLSTQFSNNLLAITRESAVLVETEAELDGLSPAQIAAAAKLATDRGHTGKWMISITNTTRQPILTSLNHRPTRQRVWEASAYRGLGRNGGIDNRPLITKMAKLRAERAQLMGYDNWAAFALEPQMAKSPEAAVKMLQDLVPPVLANSKREADAIREMIRREGQTHALEAWDWEYYAEKVRAALYDLDDAEVRPYFELNKVLHDGVFFTMNRLFGVTFKKRSDIPVYHPDVEVYEVFNEDGSAIGLFYADYFARDSKRGGAWMSSFVTQSELQNQLPVVLNVMNIPKPAPGEPALISFDHVSTMFHEMGHGVHGMFSKVMYPSLSGTAVSRDYVEFPSTFQEDWAIHPEVLANYARHYQTNAAMPKELLDRLIAANSFNQGFDTQEYVSASLLDMEWHMLTPETIPTDVEAFEQAALLKHGLDVAYIPPRYKSAFFAHVFSGGYSASYYAYIWSEVLAADAFAYMQTRGGLTRANGAHLRNTVLSKGGTRESMQQYRDFRGQDPTVDALLRRRGLNPEVGN
jgi:peptidyl-dipeptidase Dcp